MGNGQEPVRQTESFGGITLEKSAELSAVAVAAAARAEVESSYVMALRSPRNEEEARTRIKASCQSPKFAAKARFRKPVGKDRDGKPQYVVGPSIRFAEEMLRSWRNVLVQSSTIYDDASKRVIKITTRDVEANVAYSKEITLDKTVERRYANDRIVISQRLNTDNKIVYNVVATEDEVSIKELANSSKTIRNNGLRLIPQHIIDEAMETVEKTIRDKVTQDPAGARRELLDGFAARGITPVDVERYMGKPNAQFLADDLVRLRDMLTSIEDGAVTWQEYLDGTTAEDAKEMSDKSQPDTKGKAILDKIGQASQPVTSAQGQQAPVPVMPSPSVVPTPAPIQEELRKGQTAEPMPAPAGSLFDPPAAALNDQQWADILLYLDEEPDRAKLKDEVRQKMGFGVLTKLHPAKRNPFLLTLQDAAKKQGLKIETFVKQ